MIPHSSLKFYPALILTPGASEIEESLGLTNMTVCVTVDHVFFEVLRRGSPVQSLVLPTALKQHEGFCLLVLRIEQHELRMLLDLTDPEVRNCFLNDGLDLRIEIVVASPSREYLPIRVALDRQVYDDVMRVSVSAPTAQRVQMATDLLRESCKELRPKFADQPGPASLRCGVLITENTQRFYM